MTSFAFLPDRFRATGEAAGRGRRPCVRRLQARYFHARFTLEAMVHWLFLRRK